MMRLTNHICSRDEGFTLIELITVIVLMGIVGVFGGEMILQAFRGVKLSTELAVLYEEGKLAMVRMEKEIHHAIPNAIHIQGDTISFGKIDAVAQQGIFGRYAESNPTNVITDLNPGPVLTVGRFLSIYNTSWSGFNGGGAVYRVTSVTGNAFTLDSSIPSSGHSPQKRFFVCDDKAVMFGVAGGILQRHNAAIDTNGTAASFANPQPLAMHIMHTDAIPFFQYTAPTTSRNGVVIINFTIKNPDGSISLPFAKEVQVRNVP